MKYALIALALLTANVARAEVITCSQTEPFITEVFDTEAGTAQVTEAMMNKTKTIHNVKMVILAGAHIQFQKANGEVIRELDLTREGSDGMSETVYPIAATSLNGLWGGGCEASTLKAKRQN
jgi:hypothetical protein